MSVFTYQLYVCVMPWQQQVNFLYQRGSYTEVVDHLLPVLDQESGSYTEVIIMAAITSA